jgi:hypothetical protein
MALTVGMLRDILKDPAISDELPVTFVSLRGNRQIADSACGTAVIERDTNSHAAATGRIVEQDPMILKGGREKIFALYDQ